MINGARRANGESAEPTVSQPQPKMHSPHPGGTMVPKSASEPVRVRVGALTPKVDTLRCGGGFFLEYMDQNLDALASIARRNFQTLSYVGFNARELRDWVISRGLFGIDRIVPVGHTMDFSFTWDGYDLIHTLSRAIEIQ